MALWSHFLHQKGFRQDLRKLLPHAPSSPNADDSTDVALGYVGGILCGADKLSRVAWLQSCLRSDLPAFNQQRPPPKATEGLKGAAVLDQTPGWIADLRQRRSRQPQRALQDFLLFFWDVFVSVFGPKRKVVSVNFPSLLVLK